MRNETWRPIPGFLGYEASDLGRIRSIDRSVRHSNGVVTRRRGAIFYGTPDKRGYIKLKIAGRTMLLHKLVMLAFVGPPPPLHEVAHNDGRRGNCRLENLRYATHRENVADKIAHGTHQAGRAHPMARLTDADVLAIREAAHEENLNVAQIAARFSVSVMQGHRIVTGRGWRHVGGPLRAVNANRSLAAVDRHRRRRAVAAGVYTLGLPW